MWYTFLEFGPIHISYEYITTKSEFLFVELLKNDLFLNMSAAIIKKIFWLVLLGEKDCACSNPSLHHQFRNINFAIIYAEDQLEGITLPF